MKLVPPTVLLALVAACASGQSGRIVDKVEPVPMSQREIRARAFEYGRHWTGVVEEATDEIIRRTADPGVRHDAMRWRIDAVGAGQVAATRADPIAAAIDIWALAMQMVAYFETGPAKDMFGPQHEIALTAARGLEADAANMIEDEVVRERTRGRITEWVAQNPIPRSLINRPSPMPILAAMAGDPKLSGIAALRSAEQRVGDLLERLDFYMEALPQGMRWQVEYVLDRYLLSQDEKRIVLEQVTVMSNSLESVAALTRDLPELMATERERIGGMVTEQREVILDRIQRERIALLDALSKERQALADEAGAQREAIFARLREQQQQAFASLAAEREALLAAVDGQRRDTLAEIERLTRLGVAETGGEGRGAIDHFFRRAALFSGGLVAVLFFAGLVFARLVRRP